MISLGISSPKEIDLEAIAWHVGALVKYRPMDNAEATIIGWVSHAVIAVNSSSVQLGGDFRLRMNWAIGTTTAARFYSAARAILAASLAGRSIPNGKPTSLPRIWYCRRIWRVLI